jgi:very-short-patch-repair endonuclease
VPGTLAPLDFRRMLRREASDAEKRLWCLLRNRRLEAKFRRQHPVGPFVLDFFCQERRLAIELDGGQHYEPAQMARDARRTRYLEERGIRVIRFTNLELLGELDTVAEIIWKAVQREQPPSP